MAKLILIRHGECLWYSKKTFTGGMDVPLSSEGIIEALKAGSRISCIKLDIVVTSMQIRAVEAAMIALTQNENNKIPLLIHDDETIENWVSSNSKVMEKEILPVFRNRTLNLQCELQNSNIVKIREPVNKYFLPWCFNYNKPLFNNEECLKDTAERTVPFFENDIIPQLKKGKNIMISAHNSSLRPIVMFIEKLTDEEALGLKIPTGIPFSYEYSNGKFNKTVIVGRS